MTKIKWVKGEECYKPATEGLFLYIRKVGSWWKLYDNGMSSGTGSLTEMKALAAERLAARG